MNNQFKQKIEEELLQEQQEEEITLKKEEVKPAENSKSGFLKTFFTEGVVSKEAATQILPFLMFLCVLGMVYIANSHMAIKNIRNIDKLNKEVKELSWEYKSLKADLMFKSKLTEVAKKVDTLGIKELIAPPQKILVNK